MLAALERRGETLAFAESLTGGMLCDAFVSVPGASAVVRGAVVAYATPPRPEPKASTEQEGGGVVSGVVEVKVNFTVANLTEPVIIRLPNGAGGEVCKYRAGFFRRAESHFIILISTLQFAFSTNSEISFSCES